MGFGWDDSSWPCEVGDQFEMVDPEQAMYDSIPKGTVLTIISSTDDGDEGFAQATYPGIPTIGEGFILVSEEDIQEGYVKYIDKEEAMGFMLEEDELTGEVEAATENPVPKNWGARELEEMRATYTEVDTSIISTRIKQVLYDGLNNRYRSTPYRKLIKDQLAAGQITQTQVNDMQSFLNGYRWVARKPHSKAWRYQWP